MDLQELDALARWHAGSPRARLWQGIATSAMVGLIGLPRQARHANDDPLRSLASAAARALQADWPADDHDGLYAGLQWLLTEAATEAPTWDQAEVDRFNDRLEAVLQAIVDREARGETPIPPVYRVCFADAQPGEHEAA